MGTFSAERMAQVGMQDLDLDPALVLGIAREVDRGHPTFAELALDGVAVRESGLELLQHLLAHVRPGKGRLRLVPLIV